MIIEHLKAAKYIQFSLDARLPSHHLSNKYKHFRIIEDDKTDTQGFAFVEHGPNICSSVWDNLCSNVCANSYKNINTTNLFIAFRGSQQPRDWITDFNAWHMTVPYDNYNSDIRVHEGFVTAYKSVRRQVHDLINDFNPDNIIVCGHSLGGSLATLCAVDIQYNFTDNVECYSSGSPAVGNDAFVESYNKRVPNTMRTIMRKDLVPKMPPKKFQRRTGGYKHVETTWRIGPRNFLWGLKQWFTNPFKTESFTANITNHAIYMYQYWMEKENGK